MLTKEECNYRLIELKSMKDVIANNITLLGQCEINKVIENYEQLINEHFELVKKNERLSIQLVEYQRVCQLKQLRINELEKGTVSYVD